MKYTEIYPRTLYSDCYSLLLPIYSGIPESVLSAPQSQNQNPRENPRHISQHQARSTGGSLLREPVKARKLSTRATINPGALNPKGGTTPKTQSPLKYWSIETKTLLSPQRPVLQQLIFNYADSFQCCPEQQVQSPKQTPSLPKNLIPETLILNP